MQGLFWRVREVVARDRAFELRPEGLPQSDLGKMEGREHSAGQSFSSRREQGAFLEVKDGKEGCLTDLGGSRALDGSRKSTGETM